MPLIVDFTYGDGSTERVKYPVQVWRKNDNEVKKVVVTDKEIIGIEVDPDLETADLPITAGQEHKCQFDQFKAKMKIKPL